MEMTIKEKKENTLYGRSEISFSANFEGATPNRKAIREEIARLTGALADLIVVKKVVSIFGTQKAKGEANVYTTKEAMAKSRKYLLVRDGYEQKAKKEKVKKSTASASA